MHIRTAVWIAVVCMVLAVATTVSSTFAAMPAKAPISPHDWWVWIFNRFFPLLGQLGVLLFLAIFGIKGGRPPKSSRRRPEDDDREEGDGWRRR